MKLISIIRVIIALGICFSIKNNTLLAADGAKKLKAFGHENCIELKNKTPTCGRDEDVGVMRGASGRVGRVHLR